MPITPGDQIDFWITLKEGFNLIEFEARLVGRSELANVSQFLGAYLCSLADC